MKSNIVPLLEKILELSQVPEKANKSEFITATDKIFDLTVDAIKVLKAEQ